MKWLETVRQETNQTESLRQSTDHKELIWPEMNEVK